MAGVTRGGIDNAGGGIITSTQNFVRVSGSFIVVVGDSVGFHGSGLHAFATMSTGSIFARINSIPIVRAGDTATCGHSATGSLFMDISS